MTAEQRLQARRSQYQQIYDMFMAGHAPKAIARRLYLSVWVVYRRLRDACEERHGHRSVVRLGHLRDGLVQ